MYEDKNRLGEMFKKALASRKEKEQEEENKQEKKKADMEIDSKANKETAIKGDVFEDSEDELEQESAEIRKKVVDEDEAEILYTDEKKVETIQASSSSKMSEENGNVVMIKIENLEEFPNQPFKKYSQEKEMEMIDSIKINGIIQDLIVRPLLNGKYQILSGHNRKNCAIKAGLTELPCKIQDVDDDTARLMLVDTNLIQRKDFYPSETAKALKIKKDIYKKKEVKSDFFDEIIKEQNMSRGNIHRYLRLNYLIPELMDRVDKNEINLKNAENLSFLTKEEQAKLEKMLEAKPRKLTANQTKKLRAESDKNNLSDRTFKSILENNEKEIDKDIEIKFTKEEANTFFKDFEGIKEIKEFIISMLQELIVTSDKKEDVADG